MSERGGHWPRGGRGGWWHIPRDIRRAWREKTRGAVYVCGRTFVFVASVASAAEPPSEFYCEITRKDSA